MTTSRDDRRIITAMCLFLVVTLSILLILTVSIRNTPNTPPRMQHLSDEEYMRLGVVNYLESNFDNNPHFPKPDYDVSLEDAAVDNAVKGSGLWMSVVGNTAEEALKTFIAVDMSHSTYGRSTFWLKANKGDNPGTKYAVGVYKTSYSQYNVSVTISRPNPDTQEMNRNGAFVTVQSSPTVFNLKTGTVYG